jgi:hypothetical protein
MRARIVIGLGAWAATMALAACGGSDGGDEVADTAQATATVTVTAPTSDSQAKHKDTDKTRDGSSTKKGEKKKSEQTAADLSSGSGDKSDGSASGPGPGQVQATNDSPPEVTLAVIDQKSAYVKKTVVRRYAVLLDNLERDCQESRTQLAEAALTASHATAESENRLSILDVLKKVVAAHPSGVCGPAFTRVSQA